MTKIARDLWSRELLLSLYRPIESADAARLGGRPRWALCAHRWRPDQLRCESRPCEFLLVAVWLGSWDQPVASQWRDCVPRIERWGDQCLDAKLRGLCPDATIKLKLGEGIPSCLPAPSQDAKLYLEKVIVGAIPIYSFPETINLLFFLFFYLLTNLLHIQTIK